MQGYLFESVKHQRDECSQKSHRVGESANMSQFFKGETEETNSK
jgi:hypothetical protein